MADSPRKGDREREVEEEGEEEETEEEEDYIAFHTKNRCEEKCWFIT